MTFSWEGRRETPASAAVRHRDLSSDCAHRAGSACRRPRCRGGLRRGLQTNPGAGTISPGLRDRDTTGAGGGLEAQATPGLGPGESQASRPQHCLRRPPDGWRRFAAGGRLRQVLLLPALERRRRLPPSGGGKGSRRLPREAPSEPEKQSSCAPSAFARFPFPPAASLALPSAFLGFTFPARWRPPLPPSPALCLPETDWPTSRQPKSFQTPPGLPLAWRRTMPPAANGRRPASSRRPMAEQRAGLAG